MGKGVFGSRFNPQKDKFKNKNFEDTDVIFEDDETLIFKIKAIKII